MRRLWPILLVVLWGCPKSPTEPPPETDKTLTLRLIGTELGTSVWITTGDDGRKDRRYDAANLLIDPTADLELPAGTRLDAVVMVGREPADIEALTKLSERHDIGVIAGIPKSALPGSLKSKAGTPNEKGFHPESMSYGAHSRGLLPLGNEVNARVLAGGGVEFRFIDVTFLFALSQTTTELEAVTAVIPLRNFDPHELDVHPELVFADGAHEHDLDQEEAHLGVHMEPITAALPQAGESWTATTDGSEVKFPKGLYRNRLGVYIACFDEPCGTQIAAGHTSPWLIELEIPKGQPGWFLVETRAATSYLETDRFLQLPGVHSTEMSSHSHGGGGPGVPVSFLEVGDLYVHGLRVVPIEPMEIDGFAIAGVVGRNLLESLVVTLAPGDALIELTVALDREKAPRLPDPVAEDNRWQLPMDWSPAGPLVLSRLDDVPRSLVVSSGTDVSLVSLMDADAEAAETRDTSWLRMEDSVTPKWVRYENVRPHTVIEMELAGLDFENQELLIPERAERVDILGSDFIERFGRVTFDFRSKLLTLEKRP